MLMLLESHRRIGVTSLICFFVGAFFFLGFCVLTCGICQAETPLFNAKVVRVVDGDTLEIQWQGTCRHVRIWGVDTPESGQPYASRARKFTQSLLAGREVQIRPVDFDVYGRLVAMIMVDEKNISEELVRSGFAWVHFYFCNEPICDTWRGLQASAMSRKIGLWRDPYPVAPWQWKKKHFR
jgi:endonuclease YncB( thermonuclease family)